MITIKEAEEILKKEYHVDNFLYVVDNLLLPDFKADKHEVPFQNAIFASVSQLGYSEKCEVSVFEVLLKEGSQNRRVAITQEMFRILRGLGVNNAIVAFSNADYRNYRFSLLTSKYEFNGDKIVKVLSNPRRYSYSLGYGTKTKTAYDFLIDKGKVNSLDELINRFSVEIVNKQFYNEIALAFTKLVGGQRDGKTYEKELNLHGVTDQNKYAEFAVRLIGRIVFCWFLKEKKSESGIPLIPESMLALDAVNGSNNYYHDTLEPLFFELLNTSQLRRKGKFAQEEFYMQIPYLNGGLFSPHADDQYHFSPELQSGQYGLVTIPNEWFVRFYETLGQYNFTVDENTSYDIELSIDPEMLGRIFENLLAEINPETGENAKKSTGSFYTPRDIVDYMVDSSILEYLKTKTGIDEVKLRALISYSKEDDELAVFSMPEKKALINALYTVTVLDPACGSGAFPIGMLQKIVYMLQEIDPEANLWFDKAMENAPLLLKREFEKKFNAGSLDYIRKLTVIQNSIFGIDIQPIAVEIARLRCFLSLVIEEKVYDDEPNRGINPLPNLDFKFIIANTLVKLPYDIDLKTRRADDAQLSAFERQDHIAQLKSVREEYFSANDVESKNALKLEFSEIQKAMLQETLSNHKVASARYQALFQWAPFDNVSSSWFDPEWMFGVKDGFDIVIGNPPYIDSETMTKTMPAMRDYYTKSFEVAKGNWDIFLLFIELSIKLNSPKGINSLIVPNKLVAADYAKATRDYLTNNSHLLNLRDYSNVVVFGSTAVYPVVYRTIKAQENGRTCFEVMKTISNIESQSIVSWDTMRKESNWDIFFKASPIQMSIISKMKKGEILDDVAKVRGAATVGEAYEIKELLFENPLPTEEEKKLINTGTIDRYSTTWAFEKTQYIKSGYHCPVINIRQLNTRYPTRAYEAESEKIVIAGMTKVLECYYDSGCCLAGKSTTIVYDSILDLKYIIGILNSKLMTWFYSTYFNSLSLAGGFYRVGAPQIKILPIMNAKREIVKRLSALVDERISTNSDAIENQIDELVYAIYGLTDEEIAVVEKTFK